MAKYNKLWVALVGAAIVAVNELFGIGLGLDAEKVMSIIVPILTALGVWATPNKT